MKKAIQKWKAIFIAAMLCSTILLMSTSTVQAQESSLNLEQEICEKRASGITVYELYTDDGDIMGYFEPITEASAMAAYVSSTITYRLSCDLEPNTMGTAESSHSFLAGDTILVNISQNPTGCYGYIGLYDVDNDIYGFISSSATTNGWTNGTITVGYNGHFSFALKNVSYTTVHYEGTYSF